MEYEIETSHINLDAELSDRQLQVIEYFNRGFCYREVAEFMGISIRTVHDHITRINKKLGTINRIDLLMYDVLKGRAQIENYGG
jgi:DNA-binding NarL/FixJ family response regulator